MWWVTTSAVIHKIVQVSSCGLVFSFFPFPEVVRFLFFHCGFFSFFSFPVTLPGTYAGRSALTRGKPIFLWFCDLGFWVFFLFLVFSLGFFFLLVCFIKGFFFFLPLIIKIL